MHVIIIGGGVSGLTVAAALLKAGMQVTILERSGTIAGLAESFRRGECTFDLGPHIFFGKKVIPELGQFFDVKRVIVENQNLLKRGIYIQNKLFGYPLQLKEVLRETPKSKWPRIVLEIIVGNLARSSKQRTVEGWVKGKIGKTLFEYIELDTYVNKLYGISASETSSDWSKHRLKPLGNLNLWKGLSTSVNRRTKKKRYTYYCPLGIGEIPGHLADYVMGNGGDILLDSGVERVMARNGRVEKLLIKENGKSRALSGDLVISTARLPDLVKMIDPKANSEILSAADALRYRDVIILYLIVDRQKLFDRCLIYFSTKETSFKRITEFKHFSPTMAPDNVTSLAVEICVNPGDDLWGYEDEQLFEIVIGEMNQLDIVKRREVVDYFVRRVPSVYPVYFLNYQRHLKRLLNYLTGTSNLVSTGRGGLYQHDNMPTAIQSGLNVARLITRCRIHDLEKINRIVYNERLHKYRSVS
jgi:protoporphyrinogen oxidase